MSEKQREAREEELRKRTESGACTTLEGAFKVLSLAPRERLLSLTYKLGRTQEEELVHAITLISLEKQVEALSKLRMLGDSGVARHLVEAHSSRQEATFGTDRETRPEPQVDTFIELARIFRVLAEEKLCDESVRDRAYCAALRACTSKTPNQGGHRNLDKFMKEAREVCGLEFSVGAKGTFPYRDGKALKSPSGLCSDLPLGNRGLGRVSAAMNIQGSRGDQSEKVNASSAPSSLRTCLPSCASYPSHLEVSTSPTFLFNTRSVNRDLQDPKAPSPRQSSNELPEPTLPCQSHGCSEDDVSPSLSVPPESQGHAAPLHSVKERGSTCVSWRAAPPHSMPYHRPRSSQQHPAENPRMTRMTQCTEHTESHQIVTSKSGDKKSRPDQGSCSQQFTENSAPSLASLSEDLKSKAQEKELKREDKEEDKEREEETEFFSFVILHSPEDVDVAGRLKEKLECLVVGTGATFNQDFAVPGQHTLSCVEDAINNSAFTILLLSRNFNARMLEFETNSALMNSIENRHRSNTVIPLFPCENYLPQEKIPRSLRIFVPLVEGSKGFKSKVKKALAPDRIERQRAVWRQEQTIRTQRERKERLREDNERKADLLRETELMQQELHLTNRFQQQQQMLHYYQSLFPPLPGQPPAPGISPLTPAPGAYYWPCMPVPPQPQPPSIHIQNASCIMIGNDSQMTLGAGVENPTMDNREERTGDNM